MLGNARSFNNNQACYGVPKDWAWKFKKNVRLKIANRVLNHARELCKVGKLIESMEDQDRSYTLKIGA